VISFLILFSVRGSILIRDKVVLLEYKCIERS